MRLHLPAFLFLCLAIVSIRSLSPSQEEDTLAGLHPSRFEFLPIASYSTDAGVGYGIKLFFLNYLRRNESFDLILFNSTRGERWYKLVCSFPDIELRQGYAYPLALDVTVDYDKWTSYNFFGIGNTAPSDDRELYAREPLEFSLMLGKGFSRDFVGQWGVRYRTIRNLDLQDDSKLHRLGSSLNDGTVKLLSALLLLRYDTRESIINPARGLVVQSELEYGPPCGLNDVVLARYGIWCQSYFPIPHATIAVRAGMQAIQGDDLPVQLLLPVGGGSTVRGSIQDRYLDRISGVVNAEVRFPLIGRFSGMAGYDAGKVWSSAGELDLHRWVWNPAAGLRWAFDTFIARLDVGFGKETTGIFLNFGQLF